MQYKEYKTASERHLETCLKLKDVIESKYQNDKLNLLEIKKRDELLINVYYLTGYIIEYIVSYGMLKFIDIEKVFLQKKISKLTDLASIYTNHKVSYDYNDKYARWSITNPKHNIETNLTFFTLEAKLTGLNIRGIDKNIDSDLKKLLKCWNAEYRYSIKDLSILDSKKIFSFLTLAEEIHNGIRAKITND